MSSKDKACFRCGYAIDLCECPNREIEFERKNTQIKNKLDDLARIAEDLSAELYSSENKITAEKFKKIATYSRKIATCLRLHGQVPLERENKIKQALKTFDNAVKTIKSAENFVRSNKS